MLSSYLANSFTFDNNLFVDSLKHTGKYPKSIHFFLNINEDNTDRYGSQINPNNNKLNPTTFIANNNALKLNLYFFKSMLRSMVSAANAFIIRTYLLHTFLDVFDSMTYRYRVKARDWATFLYIANPMPLHFRKDTIVFEDTTIVFDLPTTITELPVSGNGLPTAIDELQATVDDLPTVVGEKEWSLSSSVTTPFKPKTSYYLLNSPNIPRFFSCP